MHIVPLHLAYERIGVILPKEPRRIAAETGAKVLIMPASVGGVAQVSDYFSLIEYDIALLIKAFR